MVACLVVQVVFFAVLLLVVALLLVGVLGFWLGLADNNEPVVFEFFNLVFPELAHFCL